MADDDTRATNASAVCSRSSPSTRSRAVGWSAPRCARRRHRPGPAPACTRVAGSSPPPRSWRSWWRGIGYLALRGDDGTAPSASSRRRAGHHGAGRAEAPTRWRRPRRPTPTPPRLQRRLRVGRSAEGDVRRRPRGLGDVGDLEVAANLDRLRTSVTGHGVQRRHPGGSAGERHRRHSSAGCGRWAARPSCPTGTIVAIGTGRFGTRDAIVVATTLADGTTSLDAVVTASVRGPPARLRLADAGRSG